MYQNFKIAENQQLQIIVDPSSDPVIIELTEGQATLFGCIMILHKSYNIFSSFAVSTCLGCELKVVGQFINSNIRNQSTIISDTHNFLERKRTEAFQKKSVGPIVLIAGPQDSGKSTICRTLLNTAAHCERTTIFVDLDVGQSSLSIPGTMNIVNVNKPTTDRFDQEDHSVYFFGYNTPSINSFLYFSLIKKLSESFYLRLKSSIDIAASGGIIDTCGWTTGIGYQSIITAAESFNVNVVIVLNDFSLFNKLQRFLPHNVALKYFDKLSGVIERNKNCRRARRMNLVKEYFYGSHGSFQTFVFKVRFSDIKVLKAFVMQDKKCAAQQVPFTSELVNQVLALSHATDDNILLTSIFGFVTILEVDIHEKMLTILSPHPEPLPTKYLLLGDIPFKRENEEC